MFQESSILSDEFLTPKEVREKLKLSQGSYDYLIFSGQLPYIRLSKRSIRHSRSQLESYLNSRQNIPLHYEKKAAGGEEVCGERT